MIGLKVRITDKVSLTIIPKQRRRAAVTLLPAFPASSGNLVFSNSSNSGLIALFMEDF